MKIKEFIETIEKYDYINIYRHVNPDGDALGSQWGLYNWIRINYPEKTIAAIGENTSTKLTNIFPPCHEPIEKKNETLSIILDTGNYERIDGKKWKEGATILKVDHHPNVDDYAELSIVDTTYSSTCEILSVIFHSKLKDKLMDEITAQYLYVGIVTDTARFLHLNTTSQTFSMASWLTSYKFDKKLIQDSLYEKTLPEIKFAKKVYENIESSTNNVIYAIMPKNAHKKTGLDFESSASMITLLQNIEKHYYSLYATYSEDDKLWKVSLRSRRKPINDIAKKHGGGGHAMASATKVKDINDVKKILKDLDDLAGKVK